MEDTRPTAQLRASLTMYCDIQNKGGTLPLYSLDFGSQYFHKEFIEKCLDELDRIPLRAAVGENPSNLEKLAYELLQVGAYVKS